MAAGSSEFHRLVLDAGGAATRAQMPRETRERARAVEIDFSDLSGYLKMAVPPDCAAWADSLRLGWVMNSEINAIALVGERHCYVALFLGVIQQLWDACLALAIHPLHFKDVSGALPVSEAAAGLGWSKIVTNILRGKTDRAAQRTLRQFEAENSQRVSVARDLHAAALNFLVMHEVHHFWCGHLFAFDNLRRRGLAARPGVTAGRLSPALRRALEHQADLYAVRRNLEAFALDPKLDRVQFLHLWLTGVSVLFIALDPHPSARTAPNADHPHAHSRFFSIAAASYTAATDLFGISESDATAILDLWMRDMVQLEVFGGGVAPPFREVLGAQRLFDGEDIEMKNRIRLSVERLEDARTRMMAYFRRVAG